MFGEDIYSRMNKWKNVSLRLCKRYSSKIKLKQPTLIPNGALEKDLQEDSANKFISEFNVNQISEYKSNSPFFSGTIEPDIRGKTRLYGSNHKKQQDSNNQMIFKANKLGETEEKRKNSVSEEHLLSNGKLLLNKYKPNKP